MAKDEGENVSVKKKGNTLEEKRMPRMRDGVGKKGI